jgi:predicted alpha-1,2-mannosidase
MKNVSLGFTFYRKLLLFFTFILCLNRTSAQSNNYAQVVNPFIGTGGHGHTYPGASMPFGMMQLSPDTRLEGWDGCGGYHYSDSLIYGFSHTHLSGTGIPDYCDVLLMPFTGEVKWKNREYASSFSHKNEKAHAGFYEVLLDKHNIKASLTTALRAGMHKYVFPANTQEGKVLIDLKHRDEVLESSIEVVNDYEVRGMRRSKSWATNQVVYFYLKFENPIRSYGIAREDQLQNDVSQVSGKNVKAWFALNPDAAGTVQVKIGISGVSMENAHLNLDTEIPGWNFDEVKASAEKAWNKELSKIEVKGGTTDEQVIFYTALYHASLAPNLYMDVDGSFRSTDGNVHKANGFINHSVFSLWDTYRALHPLMNIINKKRTGDWINTFLAQYKYGGMLPVWELSGNETFCMIGYHSVPVIADAFKKGIRNFDAQLALKAMTDYAESNRFGLNAYRTKGFISNDDDHESASKTMEYAYDDWCIAQFAKMIGADAVYQKYLLRSAHYKNLFDPSTGHIRGKVQGFWYSPFKATEVNNFFTEGNSWHYSFAVPHDVSGLMNLHGGQEKFAQKANELFTTTEVLTGREQADVTGLIGQYAQGNEPSHHMAYLFNYAGKPWLTQELVHKINKEFYKNAPGGLIGNEDCGQMSAWYIFSAMGFYPVTPASGIYALGSPIFDEVKMHLENGQTFTIKADNLDEKNFYVKAVKLGSTAYANSYIRDEDIAQGGEMLFQMAAQPNYQRAVKENEKPIAAMEEGRFVAAPYFDMASNKIKESLPVVLRHIDKSAAIYYSVQIEGQKAGPFVRYAKPFTLTQGATVRFYAAKNTFKSPVVSQQFYKVVTDRKITVKSEVHPMYTAGGTDALIDGIRGTENWKTGEWQSYYAKDFEAVIEFKKPTAIRYAGIHVLQDVSPWIVYPKEVLFEASNDGKNYQPVARVVNIVGTEEKGPVIQELGTSLKTTSRFIRIKAINGGVLPAWHESAGMPTHLFIDEIIIK